jgi:RNA 3'-phosphate cyclase
VIDIDGSYGEGGGQIVRTACSLAALTRQPCRIVNIRQVRREPGLRLQHLLAIQALKQLCGGSLIGDKVGSRDLTFRPGEILARDISVGISTAASITLIIQCVIPALLSAPRPVRVAFSGGATDTAFAPPLDYLCCVFLRLLRTLGIDVNVETVRRGYYPVGGAEVIVEIRPAKPQAIDLSTRGPLKRINLISSAAAILRQRRVAERQLEGALPRLGSLPLAPEEGIEYSPSISAGSALCIVAEFERTILGVSALGARGKMAEQVGTEAAEQFLTELNSNACLDHYMGDQILPYMALAGRHSSVTVSKITEHCRTNMWVIEHFIEGKFDVQPQRIRWTPAKATNEQPIPGCI